MDDSEKKINTSAKIKHALIMAAGRGMRMRPLSDSVPKPMVQILGRTLLEVGVSRLRPRIDDIHVTIGYKGALLAEHALELGISTLINTTGEENSWWIFNSLLKNLEEPLLVLTCDNLVRLDLEALTSSYLELGSPSCLIIPTKPTEEFTGDFIQTQGSSVKSISRDLPSNIICSGIQIMNPASVNQIAKGSKNFYEVWARLIESKQLMVTDIQPLEWCAIDTMEHLKAVERALLNDN